MDERGQSSDKANIRTDDNVQASALDTSYLPSHLTEAANKSAADMASKGADCSPENSNGPSFVNTSRVPLASSPMQSAASPPPTSASLPNFLKVPVWETALTSTNLLSVTTSAISATSATAAAATAKLSSVTSSATAAVATAKLSSVTPSATAAVATAKLSSVTPSATAAAATAKLSSVTSSATAAVATAKVSSVTPPATAAAATAKLSSVTPPATAAAATARAKDETVAVKSENDIKVYVESTMNELLGWYGLSKMDNSDTSQLTVSDFNASLSQCSPGRPASAASGTATSPVNAKPTGSSNKRSGRMSRVAYENKPSSDTNNNSSSCGADDEDDNDDRDAGDEDVCESLDVFRESFCTGNNVSDLVSPEPGGGEVPDCERGVPIICSWCQHPGNKLFTLETPTGVKSFCSELCFTQCRRASFKRNKVCEWCKHVRHTLNFVDFQDGDVQLQFCSEKCLNQYKMNVFCAEARQHLQQIHDMSAGQGKNSLGNEKGSNQQKEILITPDLWLSPQTSNTVAIKQEVSEDELGKFPDQDHESTSKTHLDGMDASDMHDSVSKWTTGVEMSVNLPISDHSSCSTEDKVGQKVKSPLMSRQRKDRLTSRPMTSKAGAKTASDSYHHQDRDRIRKLLTGTNTNDQAGEPNPGTSSVKERADSHYNRSPHKNVSALSGPSFNPQQVSSLPLLPNWATSQLFTMMPSHLNPALAAANISSSLGSLGYTSNPLLYSSLFGPTPFAIAAQKELASSGLAKSRIQARRELLRDRSLEAERMNIRGESTERSTRSTSSSYSSSDTPGPSSTPGATLTTGPELTPAFVPGFAQQLPLHTDDLSQSLPHYLTDPTVTGMFPLTCSHSHTQRGGASQVPLTPHMPAPAATSAQPPQQHPVPPITILVPYPVAVPIPVPIPIPLPIAPDKFFAFFREKSAQAKPAAQPPSTQQWSSDHRSASSMEGKSRQSSTSQTVDRSPVTSPQLTSKSLSFGRHPFVSSVPLMKSPDPNLVLSSGRDSADSIMTMRRDVAGLQQKASPATQCSSSGLKHAALSASHFTLDRPKKPRLDYLPFGSGEEAIDLSKLSSRSSTPRVSDNCSEKENTTLVKQESFSDSDVDCSSQSSNTVTTPRIHIISDQVNASMSPSSVGVGLPTPSQQSSYSGRRSRILDAPSVPKKLRSPSPERRYIRTVPRDMVEAARRRGLRARVRTK